MSAEQEQQADAPAAAAAAPEGGVLLFAGSTDWATVGRSGGGKKTDAQVRDQPQQLSTRLQQGTEALRQQSSLPLAAEQAELERQERYPNLSEPHRLKALLVGGCELPARLRAARATLESRHVAAARPQEVKIAFIAAGSSAAHCIAGDVNGVCYTWGRNEVRAARARDSSAAATAATAARPQRPQLI